MKSLIGLLLTLSMALPACSAQDASTATTEPVANAQTTEPTGTTPASNPETSPVVAQVQEPAPMPAVTAPPVRSDIVAGKHYRVLTPAQPRISSEKIEVAEVFMYSCPHCKDFEPFVNSYLQSKPSYVNFVRIPASFNKVARLHSRAFYMADTLGILEDIHMDFFEEYHTKRNQLASENAIIDFFVKQGVARDDVVNAYNSFAVDTKVRQADVLGRRYGVRSVPSLVINGKYVTSGQMAGTMSHLRDVLDYLTALEAAQL